MTRSFHELGLIPETLDTLSALGYEEPTPIQSEAIPHLLAGRDVLGQAQTGTGKTAAFALPVLQQIDSHDLQVLILTPTRELAIQVAEAVHRYGSHLGVRVLPIYGGQSYDRQEKRLRKGVQVVVGTPGRTLDLIRKRTLDLGNIRFVILDEADEMLQMGFIEDIEAILSATDASTRQTILFSATLSKAIRKLAEKYMRDPLHIAIEAEEVTADNIAQRYYLVNEDDKVAALSRLLEVEDLKNTLIFTRTRAGAATLSETLLERGYPAMAIHGDLSQIERERILHRFRTGQLTILVATDVVARGVDIPAVSHVINFDIPQLAIEYIHRIGRTGRAGRSGDAITFITPRQRHLLRRIESDIRRRIAKANLPSREAVLARRNALFATQVVDQIEAIEAVDPLLDELMDAGYEPERIAAGLIQLLRSQESQRPLEDITPVNEGRMKDARASKPRRRDRRPNQREKGMVRLYMDIGHSKGMRPGDIVYSIASTARIPGSVIGAIDIRRDETYLDVPEIHVEAVLKHMQRGTIRGKQMRLTRA